MIRLRHFLPTLALLAIGVWPGVACAQELEVQATPFSVWLDFEALAKPNAAKVALPIWMESIIADTTPSKGAEPEKTTFRIRLRRFGHLNGELQLRIFFFDKPGAAPVVAGWTETGSQPYMSPVLGTGLNLPSSETLVVPAGQLDYIDISVPGNGANLRGAYLSTLKTHEAKHALDFEPVGIVEDPFGKAPSASPPQNDQSLYGRIRATIDPGVVKIAPPDAARARYEFDLDLPPLLAVCTFDVLNADPFEPLNVWVNDRPVGSVTPHFPDLADPGYHVAAHPFDRDQGYHYTGWLRAQVVIRGSHLNTGVNKIVLSLSEHSSPVAVRNVEIQLKHPW
jgi:hypothetical protein